MGDVRTTFSEMKVTQDIGKPAILDTIVVDGKHQIVVSGAGGGGGGGLTDAQLRATPLTTVTTDLAGSGTITTQNLVPAGAATAGSAVEISLDGRNTVAIQVEGTYTGILSLQARVNTSGVWVTLTSPALLVRDTGAVSATIPSAATGLWQMDATGYSAVRVTGLAAVTGTATVNLRAAQGNASVTLDGSLPAGTATIGNVINTPVTPTSSTINSAATTNATSAKASAGTVWSITASNAGAAAAFVKLYNLAAAPTVGTSIPVLTIPVPASSVVNIDGGANGIRMSTGIALAITNLVADADTTAVAASQVKVITVYT